MSHIFPRHTRIAVPAIAGGEGCYLFDGAGKRYLDASGGAAVSCLGHGDREVIGAIKAQLDEIAFAHTGFFTSAAAEELADLLIAHAPAGIDRVFLVSGGSEAVEAAIKLARQYFLERGEDKRTRIIARKQSYHGNTLGALATGGNAWRRAPFDALLVDVSHIDPCYEYRLRDATETAERYGERAADLLEAEIERLRPENVMAFVAETVTGATLGAAPPVAGYFKRIREICDRHGILLILDEVMCGMGRTGTLFACEQEGIAPDIVCIAKGLGGGYQPVGAMLCSKVIYETIGQGSGYFRHGHTYAGHPVAAAAGRAVLKAILERDLLDKVRVEGERLRAGLQERFGEHLHVGDIRGRGLLLAVELVWDRATKQPFDPSRNTAAKIKAAAFEAGLICYPMAGTFDGRAGDHVLLAPPYIAGQPQIEELLEKLSLAFARVLPA